MTESDIIAGIAILIASVSYLKSLEVQAQQERDAKYYEWWNKSLENRKVDKPEETPKESE